MALRSAADCVLNLRRIAATKRRSPEFAARRGACVCAEAREVRKHLATAQQQPSTARCAGRRARHRIALRRASPVRAILLKGEVSTCLHPKPATRPNERPIRGSGRGTPGYAKPSPPTKKERRRPRVTPPRRPPAAAARPSRGSSLDSSDVANAPRSLRHQTRDTNDATREYRSNQTRAEFFLQRMSRIPRRRG